MNVIIVCAVSLLIFGLTVGARVLYVVWRRGQPLEDFLVVTDVDRDTNTITFERRGK